MMNVIAVLTHRGK